MTACGFVDQKAARGCDGRIYPCVWDATLSPALVFRS
jgi:hypothetical protein